MIYFTTILRSWAHVLFFVNETRPLQIVMSPRLKYSLGTVYMYLMCYSIYLLSVQIIPGLSSVYDSCNVTGFARDFSNFSEVCRSFVFLLVAHVFKIFQDNVGFTQVAVTLLLTVNIIALLVETFLRGCSTLIWLWTIREFEECQPIDTASGRLIMQFRILFDSHVLYPQYVAMIVTTHFILARYVIAQKKEQVSAENVIREISERFAAKEDVSLEYSNVIV